MPGLMAGYEISMVSVAIPLAARAFAGKTDKTGREAAILHSLRVFDGVKKHHDEITSVVALLHDTIEDTTVTVDDIRKEFAAYPPEKIEAIIDGVLSVTRGYIHRFSGKMVYSPPEAETVCDCSFRRCKNPAHEYDKEYYRDFIMRSKRHPRGRLVKIADINDNMSPGRTEGLPEDEKGIVEERYVPALRFLLDPQAEEYFTPRQLARLCQSCSKPFSEHVGTQRLCPVSGLFPDDRRFKGVK